MKTKMLLVLILLFLTVGSETPGQSPQDSIQVGGTTLRLGIAQSSVLQQLREYYALQGNEKNSANSSEWRVVSKNQQQIAYARIYFKDEKLATVLKYWDVDRPDTEVGFANALFGAVSSFEREGRTYCTIQTGQGQSPGNEIKTVFIACGQKYLRMDIYLMGKREESATITEVLDSTNSKK